MKTFGKILVVIMAIIGVWNVMTNAWIMSIRGVDRSFELMKDGYKELYKEWKAKKKQDEFNKEFK